MSKPEKSFRIGAVSASVFANKTGNGEPFHSVVLERRYKIDDEWKTSDSFTQRHIPSAIAVLQMALNFVNEREAASRESANVSSPVKSAVSS